MMSKKLTLEEVDNFYKNRTEYKITYQLNGKTIIEYREDINKARFLFNSLYKSLYGREYDTYRNITHPYNISLIEVSHSTGEELIIRGFGSESIEEIYKRYESIKEQQVIKKDSEPKSFFEKIFGISYEEYSESINKFAYLHGVTPEDWGIKL